MDLSFIILTWNSEKFISKCLDSILDDLSDERYSYEIFVIDNGSEDKTVKIVSSYRDEFPESIYPIFLSKNTGTTYSRNLGLKKAKGNYLFIIDSDVEVAKGTTVHMLKAMQQNSQVGIVAPRLLYPNGKLQKSTDVFPTIFTKIYRYFFLKIIEKRNAKCEPINTPIEVDYAISAFWGFRRSILKTVGLLDEKIFYSPEDVDYCYRVWKAGFKNIYDQGVSCIHHTQEISRGFKVNSVTVSHVKGLFYYFKKHRYFLKRPARRNDIS